MKDLRIAGKPADQEEARVFARVAFVAEYTLRIHRLVANVEPEPTLPRRPNPFLASDVPAPPISSSSPSSLPSPSFGRP